jgi:hypothetical protein
MTLASARTDWNRAPISFFVCKTGEEPCQPKCTRRNVFVPKRKHLKYILAFDQSDGNRFFVTLAFHFCDFGDFNGDSGVSLPDNIQQIAREMEVMRIECLHHSDQLDPKSNNGNVRKINHLDCASETLEVASQCSNRLRTSLSIGLMDSFIPDENGLQGCKDDSFLSTDDLT